MHLYKAHKQCLLKSNMSPADLYLRTGLGSQRQAGKSCCSTVHTKFFSSLTHVPAPHLCGAIGKEVEVLIIDPR